MSVRRLWSRLANLEAQRRPAVVAAVLQHVRQCVPSERGAVLLAALTRVDKATALAIMDQLTDTELAALFPPAMLAFVDTLPASELEALLDKENPRAQRRVWCAFQQWRDSRP